MAHLTWDDLQFFLAVAREGQLSRAARQLQTSHVTVSRRIDRLEAGLDLRLFERNPRGYELTSNGRRLVETAERMEEEAERLLLDLTGDISAQRGLLRVAMPEGFASFFSESLLPVFMDKFPNIALELITLPQVMSLSRREADLSVTLDPTKASPYHSEKIVDYALRVYGTRQYLGDHIPITTPDHLLNHPFAGYIEDMIFARGLDYLGDVHPKIRPVFKSSSIFNQLAAVRAGLCLCVLPCYIARHYDDLVPVLPSEITILRSYWLTCHRDVRAMLRERAVMEFIKTHMQIHRDHLMPWPVV
ncbi:LysR family transcriptional regulator [Roseovarius mucosus]|uniref:LysR family transcriptional regulator n=1 Tax=Roseovarius mucosus TaxID=215743 RepID=UPI0035CFB6A4